MKLKSLFRCCVPAVAFTAFAILHPNLERASAQTARIESSALSAGGARTTAGRYENRGMVGQLGGPISRGKIYTLAGGVLTPDLKSTTTPADPNAPVLSPIADQEITEDMRIEGIPFTIRDHDTSFALITVTRESSNPELIPVSGITVAGPAGNRLVHVTPLPNRSGTALIRIIVSDGTHTATESFEVRVTPVNDAPTFSPIADVTTSTRRPGSVEFTNTDIDDRAEDLKITAVSDNPALLGSGGIVHISLGAGRSRLTLTPTEGATGVALITVTVTDPAGASGRAQFRFSVTSVGEPPVAAGLDFGDAPEVYPTLLARNGARHTIVPGFHLGTGSDAEPNGQPGVTGTGDDAGGSDDEDGVRFHATTASGDGILYNGHAGLGANVITVTASAAGKLDAWLDLNRDGDWSDAGERLFHAQALIAGANTLPFGLPDVPPVAATFLRLRFSSAGGLSFDGPAADGEVEDYRVAITTPVITTTPLNGFPAESIAGAALTRDRERLKVSIPAATTGAGVGFEFGSAPGLSMLVSILPRSLANASSSLAMEFTGRRGSVLTADLFVEEDSSAASVTRRVTLGLKSAFPTTSNDLGSPWRLLLVGKGGEILHSGDFRAADALTYDLGDTATHEVGHWMVFFAKAIDVGGRFLGLQSPRNPQTGLLMADSASHITAVFAPRTGSAHGTSVTLQDGRKISGVLAGIFTRDGAGPGPEGFVRAQFTGLKGLPEFSLADLAIVENGFKIQRRSSSLDVDGDYHLGVKLEEGAYRYAVTRPTHAKAPLNFELSRHLLMGLDLWERAALNNVELHPVTGLLALDAGGSFTLALQEAIQSENRRWSILAPAPGSADARWISKWEGPEPDAAVIDTPLDFDIVYHEGVVQATVPLTAIALYNPKEIGIEKSVPWSFRRVQPALPIRGDGIRRSSIVFGNPVLMTLPDGKTVKADEVVHLRTGTSKNPIGVSARFEINNPGQDLFAFQLVQVPAENLAQDFADTPQIYPTLLAANGARHTIVPGFHLGAGADAEPNGQPSATATGDDSGGSNDEDGVQLPPALAVGAANTIKVTASAVGKLDAWLDLNRDGDWSDAGERLFNAQPLVAGVNTLTFNLPLVPTVSGTYLRFRFSSIGGLPFEGPAADGEVEDYRTSLALPGVVKQLLDGFEPVPGDGAAVSSNGRVATVTPAPGSTSGGVMINLGETRGVTFALNPALPTQSIPTSVPDVGTEDSVELIGEVAGAPRSIIGVLIALMSDAGKPAYLLRVDPNIHNNVVKALLIPGDLPTGPVVEITAAELNELRLQPNGGSWNGALGFHVPPESVIESICCKHTMLVSLLPASDAQTGIVPGATATLGDGRVLSGSVRWMILTFDRPIMSIEEANAFQALRITRRGGAASFQVSNLALIDGGLQFQGGCGGNSCVSTLRFDITDGAEGPEVHSLITSPGAGGGPRVFQVSPVNLPELTRAARGSAVAKAKLDEMNLGFFAMPAFDFNALDLGQPDSSLRTSVVVNDTEGSDDKILRSLASVPIASGGYALRWSTDANGNTGLQTEALITDTVDVMNEGTVVAGYSSITKPHADGLILEIKAGNAPVTSARIGLPTTRGMSLNFEHVYLEYTFAGPTVFTLPDGVVASGDSIVLKTGGATLVSRNPRARIEYTSDTAGEFHVTHKRPFDWGDAPLGYATRLAQNGPRHSIVPGLRLGQRIDPERNGLPSPDATGDDRNLTDDGDGVLFTSPLVAGSVATFNAAVQAPASGAFLDAFVDLNIDGDFADPGEKVLDKAAVKNGKNLLSFDVPATARTGRTFARFRLSTVGGLDFDGPALDGEVEDHAVAIATATTPKHTSGLTLVPQGGASLRTSANGGTELAGLETAAESGVLLLSSPSVLSNRSGRIVTRLQPPLSFLGRPKYEDVKLFRFVARYADASGDEQNIEVSISPIPKGLGIFKSVSSLNSATEVVDYREGGVNDTTVSIFDATGRETGTTRVQGNYIGTNLEGAANLVVAGWATFPSGCWFVFDRPVTLATATGQRFNGTVIRLIHIPRNGEEALVEFTSLGLYSANPGQDFINLDGLQAKNPSAPNISALRMVPDGRVMLEVPKNPDTFYRVEKLDVLGDTAWKPAGTFLGTEAAGMLPVGILEAPMQFFRVVAE